MCVCVCVCEDNSVELRVGRSLSQYTMGNQMVILFLEDAIKVHKKIMERAPDTIALATSLDNWTTLCQICVDLDSCTEQEVGFDGLLAPFQLNDSMIPFLRDG